MFDRAAYKKNAKECLKGNYRPAVLVMLIYFSITIGISGLSMTENSFLSLLNIAAIGILNFAVSIFFLKYIRKTPEENILFSDFLSALSSWATGLLSYLWFSLWAGLWLCLFIVPGIIKMLAYSQMFFILAENRDIPIRKAMKMSIIMTKGYKGELFVMSLSFFGWFLLSVLTCGILGLWVSPYMYVSFAGVYDYLKSETLRTGVLTESDFGQIEVKEGDSVNV